MFHKFKSIDIKDEIESKSIKNIITHVKSNNKGVLKMKKILMSLVVLVVIIGCGSSNKENMDLYTPVIEQYAKVTENDTNADIEGINFVASLYHENFTENLYSSFVDLDGNRVNELVIALKHLSGDVSILDIYTIVDNKVYRLTSKENRLDSIGERSRINLHKDGSFIFSVGAATEDAYKQLDFSKDKTELVVVKEGATLEDIGVAKEYKNLNEFGWNIIGKENN